MWSIAQYEKKGGRRRKERRKVKRREEKIESTCVLSFSIPLFLSLPPSLPHYLSVCM
jgi:hypothetical protein